MIYFKFKLEANVQFGKTKSKKEKYTSDSIIANTIIKERYGNQFNAYLYNVSNNYFEIAVACHYELLQYNKLEEAIRTYGDSYEELKLVPKEIREITESNFNELLNMGYNQDYLEDLGDIQENLELIVDKNSAFNRKEEIVERTNLTKEEACNKARQLLASDSLKEEIDRIYAECNRKEFVAHPVHYKIVANNYSTAYKIQTLLVQCLVANKRLLSSRVEGLIDIRSYCYEEEDIENIIKNAKGSAISLTTGDGEVTEGQCASEYQRVVESFKKEIIQAASDTLFFIIVITKTPGFSIYLLNEINEHVEIVTIEEGAGNKEEAREYIHLLAQKDQISNEEVENLLESLEENVIYRASDLEKKYREWYRKNLREVVYPAYKKCDLIYNDKRKYKGSAIEELGKLIGLEEVKKIVQQILAYSKAQKMREEIKKMEKDASMHMLFTGNPGTAKTTVARLLARILKDNRILDSGEFIECGRKDLVGKYVGWTAKEVKEKFEEAKGGILFIDEAYSLVDGDNSFGDEAINTIVSEMENNRRDVLVIFAGYTEKMERFLGKNEGLRSRITFHIHFPDYTVEELVDILNFFAVEKGFTIEKEAKELATKIFEKAHKIPEFGNGRFVRNMLEQAIMKQSERLIQDNKSVYSEAELFLLKKEDFDINLVNKLKGKDTMIGFR